MIVCDFNFICSRLRDNANPCQHAAWNPPAATLDGRQIAISN
jgi:hypothetical protein